MSSPLPSAVSSPSVATGRAGLTALTVIGAAVIAVLTLYAVLLDQGALLSPALGEAAARANYLHELAHDARHVLGAPCH